MAFGKSVLESMMRNISRVTCPLHCGGWLIPSMHRNCFDRDRQIWSFVCPSPNCRHVFEIPGGKKFDQEEVRVSEILEKYPRFISGRFSRYIFLKELSRAASRCATLNRGVI
jgi:hypothetical protein